MRERTIVFATDLRDSDLSHGVALATQLAVRHAATLLFVHVVALRTEDGAAMLYSGLSLSAGEVERRLQALAPDDPAVPCRHLLRVGDPLEQLAGVVEQEGADMLVMAVRRRSLWQRLRGPGLLHQLQCRVDCPVVTYRGGRERPRPAVRWPRVPAAAPDALSALLDARTDALQSWLTLQRDAVSKLARRPAVRDGIASLARGRRWPTRGQLLRQIEVALRLELEEHRRALGAIGVEVHSPWSDSPILKLGLGARDDDARARWLERLRLQGIGISLPLDASGARDHGCVIQAGALVPLSGDDAALLIFTLDARRDFLRILAQPGPAPSAETYAFDQQGLMLSYSRFPDQLRRVGLLPAEPGSQTPRRLHVCDPGGNLLCGEVALGTPRPLTRMAAAATAGEDGHDWTGYRDYRGVAVVGAWRWLYEYGFGVAAEMDAS